MGKMQHNEGEFQGYRNYKLYYQSWLPDSDPKAVILAIHGLAEHSGRFENLVSRFVPKNYAVYSYDQRGHGKSPGERGYIENFSLLVEDLGVFLEFVRNKHKNKKLVMIAHSIGGTVATAYTASHQNGYNGLVLSGPTLKPGASVPRFLITIAPILSFLIPKVGLYIIDAPSISSDKSVVEAYIKDPLVYRGKISTRMGVEIIKTMQGLTTEMSKIDLPLLIMYGTADKLSEPAGCQMLFEMASSKDKTLKTYEGFYHEIFNEPKREQVFKDLEGWLEERV
jgi:acylglycerol lipase